MSENDETFISEGDNNGNEGMPLEQENNEKYEIKNKAVKKIVNISKKNIYILIIIILIMLIFLISYKKS